MTDRKRRPAPVRVLADDPNTFERAAMYIACAELLDPRPVRPLATVSTSSPEAIRKETAK